MTTRPLTVGEYRVGITFNPSNNPLVDEIKQAAAHLIDRLEYVKERQAGNGEAIRCAAIAQTEIESAAMWAVKAATKAASPGAGVPATDYRQRVIIERNELDEKIGKLKAFAVGEKFGELDRNEAERMLRQLDIMQSYSEVLGERIAAFPVDGAPKPQ